MIHSLVDVVVDAANVIGSRPDGWWRDRAGAATRLLARLALLPGREAPVDLGDDWAGVRIGAVHVVLEGLARAADDPPLSPDASFAVVRAERDGDSAIVELVEQLAASAREVLVVTADRGLRARLPGSVHSVGPRWLLAVIDAETKHLGAGPEV